MSSTTAATTAEATQTTTGAAATSTTAWPWPANTDYGDDQPIFWADQTDYIYTITKLQTLIANSTRPLAIQNATFIYNALQDTSNDTTVQSYIDLVAEGEGVTGLERILDDQNALSPGRAASISRAANNQVGSKGGEGAGIALVTTGVLLGGGAVAGSGVMIYRAKKNLGGSQSTRTTYMRSRAKHLHSNKPKHFHL